MSRIAKTLKEDFERAGYKIDPVFPWDEVAGPILIAVVCITTLFWLLLR